MTKFNRTNSDTKEFRNLVALLDADLKIRDGEEHSFYNQFNKIDHIRNVIVCYMDENAIGCGAFKPYDQQRAEIKRMFVISEYRGYGIALKILNELEIWASELHFTECILETGKRQFEAIGLYKKAGYTLIKNYGQYEHIENSICMTKRIR